MILYIKQELFSHFFSKNITMFAIPFGEAIARLGLLAGNHRLLTVNPEFFVRNIFSQIALKDIFATFKISE